mmetsp:Transcript_86244/g.247474  ORF Transcript_86244/g.247474 Transcript_86244/m.247474 type:complete len:203 (+) Transcript_86244:374-982(+)
MELFKGRGKGITGRLAFSAYEGYLRPGTRANVSGNNRERLPCGVFTMSRSRSARKYSRGGRTVIDQTAILGLFASGAALKAGAGAGAGASAEAAEAGAELPKSWRGPRRPMVTETGPRRITGPTDTEARPVTACTPARRLAERKAEVASRFLILATLAPALGMMEASTLTEPGKKMTWTSLADTEEPASVATTALIRSDISS